MGERKDTAFAVFDLVKKGLKLVQRDFLSTENQSV